MIKDNKSIIRRTAIRSVLLVGVAFIAFYFYSKSAPERNPWGSTAQGRERMTLGNAFRNAATSLAERIGLPWPKREKPPELERQSLIFRTMSTAAAIDLQNEDLARIRKALPLCRAALESVNGTCNIFDPKSELSRLNASAYDAPFECSPELWSVLTQARRFYRLSGGAFDVTIDPLMRLWGFGNPRENAPTEEEIAEAKKHVGLDKVEFDDAKRTVRFTAPGMSINLGGIAKGYALDLAAAEAKRNGISCGWIDLGGNILALPDPPPGRTACRAGLRDPFLRGKSFFGVTPVLNEAISTSGNYERNTVIDGVRYGHIVDPRTGRPTTGRISVTAIAPTGIESDALSTTIFLRGPEIVPELTREFPTLRVLIVQEKDGVLQTLRFGSGWEGVPDAKKPTP